LVYPEFCEFLILSVHYNKHHKPAGGLQAWCLYGAHSQGLPVERGYDPVALAEATRRMVEKEGGGKYYRFRGGADGTGV